VSEETVRKQPESAPEPGSKPTRAQRRRRRTFRPLRWLLALLAQLLVLILLLLGVVLGTQTGLRMAIGLAEDLAPDMISVGTVDGRILGELRISDLALTLPGLDLDLGSLHLDWSPAALFGGTLRVNTLEAADIDIVVAPAAEKKEPEPFALPEVRLPIGIDLERLLVERLRFAQQGAPEEAAIRLARAELSATALGERVDLRRLQAELTQPRASASAEGQARLTGAYPIELDLDWHFEQAPALTLSGAGRVGGDLDRMTIEHRIDGSIEARLDATLTSVLDQPAWTANIQVDRVQVPDIAEGAPPLDLTAALKSAGDLDNASLTGELTLAAPDLPDAGRLRADLDLGWQDPVLAIRALRINEIAETPADAGQSSAVAEATNPAMLELTGRLDLGADGTDAVPTFALDGTWERLRWPLVGDPIAASPGGEIKASGSLDDYDYSLAAQAAGTEIPETSVSIAGTGDQQQTRIDELVVETLGGRIEGKGRVAWAPTPSWALALTAEDIDPGRQLAGLDGTLSLKAETKGDLDDGYDFDVKLDAALDAYPPAVLTVAGTGSADQARVEQLRIETLGGLVQGQGELAWSPTPTWQFDLSAADLDPGRYYPDLDGRVSLEASTGGGLEQGFGFKIAGEAVLAQYPPTRIDLAGTGTADAARVDKLAIQTLGGRIDGTADIAWAPQPSWDAALTLADLDPGQVLADWPGSLGGRIASEGRNTEDGPVLSATISDFGGELRGYPVRLVAAAGMDGEVIRLDELTASSGETRLSASGRIADVLDLRFDLESPDLGAVLPGAEGRLSAEGQVGGTPKAPSIALTLDGADVAINGQGIEVIKGQADVGLGEGGEFQIDIGGSNLVAGGQRFESLAIDGSGSIADHSLTLALTGDTLGLNLAADGALGDAGAYSGSLQRLDLSSELLGEWGLRRPAPYSIDAGRIAAGPLCIGNGLDSGACVEYTQLQPGRFDASLDMDRFGLEVLNPLLPELMVMDGYVRGRARFSGAGDQLTGDALIELPAAEAEIALPDTKDKLVFAGTRLAVQAGGGGLDATFALPLEGVGRVDASVGLPGFRLGGAASQPLRGGVDAQLQNLSRLSVLFPDVTRITGGVTADLNLGGTVSSPDLRGNVAVREVGLAVPLIGLEISNANLTATSVGSRGMEIDGSALVGGGRLQVDGSVSLAGEALSVRFNVAGDKLKVADSKEYFALVSLDLRGGVGPGGGALQGRIKVPEARIMPRTIPSGAVQPSPDVVLEEQGGGKEPLPFHIDVLAELGNSVQIEAFGLRGRLAGQLRVVKEPGRELAGDGQLEVVDGTYRVTLPGFGVLTAVGKPLTIEQGIIVFQRGSPITNPGLILNAQREGGDMTAGVRVLGSLQNPKLAFFSESDPGMTQAEITRYLVTGIPPKRGAGADDRALSVGTYVAPKIFMEYESSLGEQSDKVKMRYDLNNRIELQAETGDAQGGDIFFKFEN